MLCILFWYIIGQIPALMGMSDFCKLWVAFTEVICLLDMSARLVYVTSCSEERLGDVLVAREELDLDRLVQEATLVEKVEADKCAGELLKLNKSFPEC